MSGEGGYDETEELAELYDLLPMYGERGDVAFYVELCRQAGQALEIGCGTGRILIPAAQAGCEITGVDGSIRMLDRCRAKAAALAPDAGTRITLVQADMRRFHLGRQFPLITIPFRPFQHLISIDDQLAALACARRHLLPQGRLVFDTFQPNLKLLSEPVTGEEFEDTARFPISNGRELARNFRITAQRTSEQISDVELIYYVTQPGPGQPGATRRIVQAFPFRYFFRWELEHLLARAGFKIVSLRGNFDGSPLTDSSPEFVITATPYT